MKTVKTYIINSLLSYLPIILWLYMFFFFFFVSNNWYAENHALIDFIDTPFYIISALHFMFCLFMKYWFKKDYFIKLYEPIKIHLITSIMALLLLKWVYINFFENNNLNYEFYK